VIFGCRSAGRVSCGSVAQTGIRAPRLRGAAAAPMSAALRSIASEPGWTEGTRSCLPCRCRPEPCCDTMGSQMSVPACKAASLRGGCPSESSHPTSARCWHATQPFCLGVFYELRGWAGELSEFPSPPGIHLQGNKIPLFPCFSSFTTIFCDPEDAPTN